jgi:hypothetical protein
VPHPEFITPSRSTETVHVLCPEYALALFINDPSLQVPFHQRSQLLDQWDLTIEFLELRSRQPVTFNTQEIDWQHPRFQVGPTSGNVIPADTRRPRSTPINSNQWYNLEVCYT